MKKGRPRKGTDKGKTNEENIQTEAMETLVAKRIFFGDKFSKMY